MITEAEKKQWESINDYFKHGQNIKKWKEKGFSWKEVKEWVDADFSFARSGFCQYLRDVRKLAPEKFLKSDEERLRKECDEWMRERERERERNTKFQRNEYCLKGQREQFILS